MTARLYEIVIDAADPAALAQWWAGALGWKVVEVAEADEGELEIDVAEAEDGPLFLTFVTVAEEKAVKNRVHFDLATATPEEQASLVDRLLASGAIRADIGQDERPGGVPWVVLADPEGNELCVLEPRDRFAGRTLASIVVDCTDPRREAEFWRQVLGWQVESDSDAGATLADPDGRLPDLDFIAVPEPKVVKDRLHLDLAPWANEDQAAEVDRIVALGASRTDVGQGPDRTWVVLSDPEGHEFCVLSARDD